MKFEKKKKIKTKNIIVFVKIHEFICYFHLCEWEKFFDNKKILKFVYYNFFDIDWWMGFFFLSHYSNEEKKILSRWKYFIFVRIYYFEIKIKKKKLVVM